jgi:hypothetical protein
MLTQRLVNQRFLELFCHTKAICEATAIPPSQQRLLMGCEALNVPHMQLAPSTTSRHIVAITVMKL